jgi:hypothetical protein
MSFEIEGDIVKIFDTEKKTDTFQTREFVIKTEGQYPQFIKFQLTQDRCDIVDKYNVEQKVKVSFDLRGREWNEKYFTNLNAWRIDQAQVAEPQADSSNNAGAPFQPIEQSSSSASDETNVMAEDFDDLPF